MPPLLAFLFALLFQPFFLVIAQVRDLNLIAGWSEMEYEFPTEAIRQQALASGEYVRGIGSLNDVDIDYGASQGAQRIFITVPRIRRGVPITLGTLTNQTARGGPLIRGYPDYAANSMQGTNCDGLTSVFHVEIDDCRRLWVVDNGKIGTSNQLVCYPQIVIYDLATDAELRRYRIPITQFRIGSSLWSSFTLDQEAGQCNATRAYLGDNHGHGVLVYDLAQNVSWRAQNKFTYPAPHAGTYTIAGQTFDMMDGIFSVSLTPRSAGQRNLLVAAGADEPEGRRSHGNRKPHHRPPTNTGGGGGSGGQQPDPLIPSPATWQIAQPQPGVRYLYFHSLASTFEVAVPLSLLNNQTVWEASVESYPRAFQAIGWRRIQAAAEVVDTRNENQFFGLINPIAIGCWNVRQPYDTRTLRVVAQNEETLQFTSGLKVKRNMNTGHDELWVATNRQQARATGTLNPNVVNFRVQSVPMDRLVSQGRCLGRTLE